MGKLDRGPSALNKAIGKGLESETPDWATLQKQSSEYASLVAELGKLEPPEREQGFLGQPDFGVRRVRHRAGPLHPGQGSRCRLEGP